MDDEEDCRLYVRSILEDEGFSVHEADCGCAAASKAREIQPALVILDIQMPDKNGLEVISDLRLQQESATVPVVMLTGIADQTGLRFSPEEMEDWVGEKPEAYLEKPVSPNELKRTVRRILEDRGFLKAN
ncbi:MAG TPA: response regulator [bacterium]|nr:response regulator [bacterium]